MPKEVDPKDTTRAAAYALWTKAPNPMVTFFKTFDVTNLIKVSKKRRYALYLYDPAAGFRNEGRF